MNRRTALKSTVLGSLLDALASVTSAQTQRRFRPTKSTFVLGQPGESVAVAAGDDQGISLILGTPGKSQCRLTNLTFESGATSEIRVGESGYISLQREAGGRQVATRFRYPSLIEVISCENGQITSRTVASVADKFPVSCQVTSAHTFCMTEGGELLRWPLGTKAGEVTNLFRGIKHGRLWLGQSGELFLVDRATANFHRIAESGESFAATLVGAEIEQSRRWLAQAASRNTQAKGVPTPIPILMLAHSVSREGVLVCIPAPLKREEGMTVLTFSSSGRLTNSQTFAIPDRVAQPTLPVGVFLGKQLAVVFANGVVYYY